MIPPAGIISEVYHAQKWRKDVDRHTLSPMYDAGDRHYYIDELACLKNGNLVIPMRWLEDDDGGVFADAYAVTFDNQVGVFPLSIAINPWCLQIPAVYCQCR